MAIRYHFDLYPHADPRDGDRIVRFTKIQQASYQAEANGTGSGQFAIRAGDPECNTLSHSGMDYIRVVREDPTADPVEAVVGGFWTEQGDVQVLDKNGTHLLVWGGAGTLAYLDRAVMWPYAFATDQIPQDGVWDFGHMFGQDITLGHVLWKVIREAKESGVAPVPAPDRATSSIPDVTLTFDNDVDSDGNAWTLEAGEFRADVGENVIDVVKRLMEAGLYVEMDPDTFD